MQNVTGLPVWLVRVTRGELTCLACGETFSQTDICPRCGLLDNGEWRAELPPAVPTTTYLRPEEYEVR